VPSGLWLHAWPSAQGAARRPVFVTCWPMAHQTNISFSSIFLPNAEIFYHFHQFFIIFTNITINSTYTQVITTPTVHFHQAATRPIVGTGRARAMRTCLGGGPSIAWSIRPGQPGPSGHRAVPCSGRAKLPSHGPGRGLHGHL